MGDGGAATTAVLGVGEEDGEVRRGVAHPMVGVASVVRGGEARGKAPKLRRWRNSSEFVWELRGVSSVAYLGENEARVEGYLKRGFLLEGIGRRRVPSGLGVGRQLVQEEEFGSAWGRRSRQVGPTCQFDQSAGQPNADALLTSC